MKYAVGAAAVLLWMGAAAVNAQTVEWPQLRERIQEKYAGFTQAVQDIKMTQQMEATTEDGTMTSQITIWRRQNKFRSDAVMSSPGMPEGMPEMKTTVIDDGSHAWVIMPMVGKQKLPDTERPKDTAGYGWWDMVLSQDAQVQGVESVDGNQCYVVAFTNPAAVGFPRIWLDTKRLVALKMEQPLEPEGGMTVVTFSGFKPLAGKWEMATELKLFHDEAPVGSMRITSVEINTGFPDNVFDLGTPQSKPEASGGMFNALMQKMMDKEVK